MTSRSWTTSEVKFLRTNGTLGATQIAVELGRSETSVRKAAQRFRISLRTAGTRKGLILGQPRGVSLTDPSLVALRTLIISGRLTSSVIAERLSLAQKDVEEAPLCPRCSKNPVRVISTGLCKVCHLKELTFIAEEALAEFEARKPLQNAWQRKSRLQRALEQEQT